ncbi:MAG TPA: metallophosphoesterase family protein [Bacteroidota bacterium]|nr:metallophosphoesterase family protein [Bacteroidota bacterium]
MSKIIMRIAVISDIHSNLEALTAALHIIDGQTVDDIVCLGDIVGYGANPNECLSLVRQRCRFILQGNHEAAVINIAFSESFTELARTAALWTRNQLTENHLQFLGTLPLTVSYEHLFFVHASPNDPSSWEYLVNEWDAILALQSFSEPICFIGHTHVPGIFSIDGQKHSIAHGQRYLINVGSIGQPRDRNPQLSFGIFDSATWTYQNFRASYDIETASKKIIAAQLPILLGQRLFLGV